MNTLQPLVEFYKTHEWGQGQHSTSLSRHAYCLVEARIELNLHPMGAIGCELRRRSNGDIVWFNDWPGRTFAEVMAMLEQDDTA